MPEADTEFARLLRMLRLHAGHPSDREIADRAGLSHTVIGNSVRGRQVPSWQTAVKIIEALDGDPGDFQAAWEAACSGVPATPGEQVLGAIRELQLQARLNDRRLGSFLDHLTPEMLAAGLIPGLPPLGEYATGVDHGRVTVWHDAPRCQQSAVIKHGGEFIGWVVGHHREEHASGP
jgi:DNA-binding XRE family transcriptional regulator